MKKSHMISNTIAMEEAKTRINEFDYGLVYLFGQILLGRTEKIKEKINWEECIEARFFSKEKELHIFDYNGMKRAVCITDTDDESGESYPYIEKRVTLDKKFQRESGFEYYKKREYITYDEDGQAVVYLTRMAELI